MTNTDTVVDLHERRLLRAGLTRAARFHHDDNPHRAARRQEKADALRVVLKDHAYGVYDVSTVDGLRGLAGFARAQKDNGMLWSLLAQLAGVPVPGASYDPTRDRPADKYRTIYMVADDLDLDAADLAEELSDSPNPRLQP